jgi:phage terminase large subunit GpA-like protein
MTDIDKLLEGALESFEVDDSIMPSDWAELYRVLSGYAAEPGPMSFKRAPFQVDIINSIKHHQNICFMKSSQVGATEIVTTLIGCIIDTAKTPTPIMMIHATTKSAEKYAKDRLMPMFRDSPRLSKLLDMSSRNSDNSMLHKRFINRDATLDLVGSNSPAALASQTIRFLIADEIDKYPTFEIGDALTLAVKRTQTFKNHVTFFISTPTIKGRSRIERIYSESDQRQYYVPCPECEHEQTLVISRLVYVDDVAHYLCESCNTRIAEHHKPHMVETGRWIAKYPKRSEKQVGFHINELYSPWSSWQTILDEFHKRKGNDALLKPFYNEVLGLPYDEVVSDAPGWNVHMDDRLPRVIDGNLPDNVTFLTAACDVQKDRLEVIVTGWHKRICTVIERITIPGNTQNIDDECWNDLTKILSREWTHTRRGVSKIRCLAVDSGDGNSVNSVYNWARRINGKNTRRIMIIKGMGIDKKMSREIGDPSDIEVRIEGRRYSVIHKLWPVNTHMIKSLIYGILSAQSNESKHRFVFTEECDEEFFKQLTAETLVKNTQDNGETKLVWKQTYRDNHALDMIVYNYAVYYHLQWHTWNEKQWAWYSAAADIIQLKQKIENTKLRHNQREMRRNAELLGLPSDGPSINLTGSRTKKSWVNDW